MAVNDPKVIARLLRAIAGGIAAKALRHDWIFNAAADMLEAAVTPGERGAEIVRLIDVLRSDEGDSVMILCDNPDFNGQPNCAIVCNGDWTGWVDKRFAADTILDALSMAMVEKNLPSPRKVIATSNGHHWVEQFNLVCCRDCGFIRRHDDQNSPCKGRVGIGIRRDLVPPPVVAGADRAAVIEECAKVADDYPLPDHVSDDYHDGFIDASAFIAERIRALVDAGKEGEGK
jgi:hypothetical protein